MVLICPLLHELDFCQAPENGRTSMRGHALICPLLHELDFCQASQDVDLSTSACMLIRPVLHEPDLCQASKDVGLGTRARSCQLIILQSQQASIHLLQASWQVHSEPGVPEYLVQPYALCRVRLEDAPKEIPVPPTQSRPVRFTGGRLTVVIQRARSMPQACSVEARLGKRLGKLLNQTAGKQNRP
jgi:hypothetical protein